MATSPPPGDPRPFARLPGETGAMPVVARPRGGLSNLAIGLGVAAAGLILFAVLDSRRRDSAAPAVRVAAADRVQMASPPPPLYVPPTVPTTLLVPETRLPPVATSAPPPAPQQQVVYVPQAQPYNPPPAPVQEAPPPPPRVAMGPALVFDGSPGLAGAPGVAGASGNSAPALPGMAGGRARSGAFANRGTTVPQGTLIPAVLETALNSNRPGLARAIVSRDVRGFDGSRILIPRGSRLIGEYRSETGTGQRRALVNWTRLVRPDGVTIAIGSPASDTMGRAGIKADVNTHFFQRFAGAILQSALDIGVNLASTRANSGTTVVLPTGGLQGTTQIIQPPQLAPTLKVKAGTSISIFAARDLDFSSAENCR